MIAIVHDTPIFNQLIDQPEYIGLKFDHLFDLYVIIHNQ